MQEKVESGMQDLKNQLNGQLSNKTAAMTNQAKKAKDAVTGEFADQFENVKQYTSEAYETSVEQVKKYPLASLGAALAIGLVAGWAFGRRK